MIISATEKQVDRIMCTILWMRTRLTEYRRDSNNVKLIEIIEFRVRILSTPLTYEATVSTTLP